MTLFARLLRFTLSVVALSALVIGVPALLVRFGSISLSDVPSPAGIVKGLGNPLGDDAILAALNLVVWTAWLAFIGTLAVELSGQLFDRRERHLPYLGSFQWLACRLVAGLLVVGSFSHAARASAAKTDTAPTEQRPTRAARPTPTPPVTRSTPPAPLAPRPETIEVQAGDSAWALAERYYGDGTRWRALWELNRDRPQADGRAWTDPDLLRPGWLLRLPNPGADTAAKTGLVTVEPGDTLSAIAAERYGDPSRYVAIYDANVDRPQADGDALHDPNLIRPGWVLELPPTSRGAIDDQTPPPGQDSTPTSTTAPTPTAPLSIPATPSEPTTTIEPSPRTTSAPSDRPVSSDESQAREVRIPLPLLGVASAGIALGVLQLIRHRRARRRLQLPVEKAVAPPFKGGSKQLHAELASAADPTEAHTVAAALRSIACAAPHAVPAQPVLLQIGTDWIDVQLDQPSAHAPAPWQPSADGTTWQWERSGDNHNPDSEDFAPLPTLVSIGAAGEDGQRLLLNLEACGLVSIVGDAAEVDGLAASIALELAVSPLADAAGEVVMIGRDFLEISELDGVRSVDRFDEVADDLVAAGDEIAEKVDELAPTAFALRASGRATDGWPPVVAFVASRRTDEAWERARLRAASRRGGLVIVTVGWVAPDAEVIEASEGVVRLPGLGVAVLGQHVEPAALHGIDEALHEIELDEEPVEPPLDEDTVVDLRTEAADSVSFIVRVLGPVKIDGLDSPMPPKATAAVVYAALHRPTHLERIRDQVWGGRDVSPKTVSNTFNRARSILGAAAVPHVDGGVLTLGPSVACDVDLFDHRVANGDLRSALELVAGRPFTLTAWEQRDSYLWVEEENLESRWDARVAAVAHQLAEDALARGDVDLARWAAEKGLLASPAHPSLVVVVARAHLMDGNSRAAERACIESLDFHESLGLGGPAEIIALLDEIRSQAPTARSSSGT